MNCKNEHVEFIKDNTNSELRMMLAFGILQSMKSIRDAFDDDCLFSAFSSIQSAQHCAKKGVDEAYEGVGECPKCKALAISNASLGGQFLPMAIAYLLQNKMINNDGVTLPSIDVIVDYISKNGFGIEDDLKCQKCGFEEYALMAINI